MNDRILVRRERGRVKNGIAVIKNGRKEGGEGRN